MRQAASGALRIRAGQLALLLVALTILSPAPRAAQLLLNPAAIPWSGGSGAVAPAAVADPSGSALRFVCAFDQAAVKRVAWDADFRADLRPAAGVSLRFRAQPGNMASVSRLFVYLRSGKGWYGAALAPKSDGAWEDLVIWKSATFIEGNPGGWGHIDGIRIAATPLAARQAAFDLGGLTLLPADPRIAVLRATSALSPTDSTLNRSIADFPERLCRALRRGNVQPMFLDDPDLADGFLENRRVQVLILPYNGAMAPAVAQHIAKYLASGGRVIGFYSPSPSLAACLDLEAGAIVAATKVEGGFGSIVFQSGAPTGAPPRVQQASWVVQDLRPASSRIRVIAKWANAAGHDTGYAAVLSSPHGFWVSHVYLDADPDAGLRMLLALVGNSLPDVWREAARAAVRQLAALPALRSATAHEVLALSQQASAQLTASEYVEALESAAACREAAERTELAAQVSQENEFRGAWCHRSYGVPGWNWDTSVRNLKACGFNAIFANIAWAGEASYASRQLPLAAPVNGQQDQLRLCADACRKYGVQLHAWIACFNLGETPPESWVTSLRSQGRLQKNWRGEVDVRWLCPSNPANRRLQADVASEIVRNYPVAGIHLDFVRYADKDHCFCEECRRQFEAWTGRRVNAWPAALREDPQLARQWAAFRCAMVTAAVQEIATAVAREKPGVVVSAAVFDNPATAREAVGQDWPDWCAKHYVRFVAPMNYTADEVAFRQMLARQLQEVRGSGAAVYPGIGVRAAHLTALQTCRQISISRSLGTGGFVIFEYNRDEATGVFPDLARGITKP